MGNFLSANELPPGWPWRGFTVSSTSVKPENLASLSSKINYNSLSLTLDVRLFAQKYKLDPDSSWKQNIIWADSMLDMCKKLHLNSVISMSQFPIDPALGFIQDSPLFWENIEYLNQVLILTEKIAEHFANRGSELAAYEILNEPLLKKERKMLLPPQWIKLLDQIILIIRKKDPSRWIIITPGIGALPKGYENFKPLNDNKIIYGTHMYIPHDFTHQGIQGRPLGFKYPGIIKFQRWSKNQLVDTLKPLRLFQIKYNVPVLVGEFSAARWAPGGETYLKDLVSIFNEYCWGWMYFDYMGYHGWNPDYDSLFSTDRNGEWEKHFVGEKSIRWKTLKKIFPDMHTPN
jgi:aryl-phospho-beta-D-glucosidase BglC (GH1 family)